MNRVFDCRGLSKRWMVSLASISQYLVSPGDSAVRVAAAAAHLRPLHAPRLTHPHPHQVSLRGSRAANGTSRKFTVPGEIPLLSAKIITNAWFG